MEHANEVSAAFYRAVAEAAPIAQGRVVELLPGGVVAGQYGIRMSLPGDDDVRAAAVIATG